MPVCHVGGLSILTRCLLARRAVILEPRFDPDAVLAAIVRERVTLLSVVPTMLAALLERDREGALGRLRAVLVGGAGAPFALIEACAERGIPALTTYGLTEACSQVTVQRLTSPYRAARGSGEPLSGVELRIAGTGSRWGRPPYPRPSRRRAAPARRGRARPGTRAHAHGRVLSRPWPGARSRPRSGRMVRHGRPGRARRPGHAPRPRPAQRSHRHGRRERLPRRGGAAPRSAPRRATRAAPSLGVPEDDALGARRRRRARAGGGVWGRSPHRRSRRRALLGSPLPAWRAALAPHKRPRLACVVEALSLTASGKLERAGAAARHGAALRPLAVRR